MSKKQHITWGIRLGVFFLVLLLVIGGFFIWVREELSPLDTEDTTDISFVVKTGEPISSIIARLSAERVIKSRTAFFLLVKYLGVDNKIQAGNFNLKRSMTAETIARELTQGSVDVWVTTLEGWRKEEIAETLSKELGIPEREFNTVAQEGYMFPDTYLIPKSASAAAVADIFRATFDKKVTAQMRQDAEARGLSMDQVVVLASIVEREGKGDDKPTIAGILWKRINNDWPLQTDATLQYILGYQATEKSWWKKSIYDEDKKIDSPYNTYKNTGLPPAPISNPGLASIKAVIYPEESEYWFYLHDPNGEVHYAKTLEEHEKNIATYLQ